MHTPRVLSQSPTSAAQSRAATHGGPGRAALFTLTPPPPFTSSLEALEARKQVQLQCFVLKPHLEGGRFLGSSRATAPRMLLEHLLLSNMSPGHRSGAVSQGHSSRQHSLSHYWSHAIGLTLLVSHYWSHTIGLTLLVSHTSALGRLPGQSHGEYIGAPL